MINDLIFGLGVMIAVLSVYGLLRPNQLMSTAESVIRKPWGMYFAVGIRLLLAALFLAGAENAAKPGFITTMGWLMLAAAVGIVIMGQQRVVRLMQYFSTRGNLFIRSWLVFGIVLGLAIAWAA